MDQSMEEEVKKNDEESVGKPVPVQKVFVLRDWKEYIGEAVLIIFSVFLGLAFTEFINKSHEKSQTGEIIQSLISELENNRKAELEQYQYQLNILKTIDSALASRTLQNEILSNGDFNLKRIAPYGVLYRNLSSTAWEVAKSQNIESRLSIKTISALTAIYTDQAKILKVEDEIARVIFAWESRKIENIHTTLILIRDNYKGWAFDRANGLIDQYSQAIGLLNQESK